jgi:hypothetical protein
LREKTTRAERYEPVTTATIRRSRVMHCAALARAAQYRPDASVAAENGAPFPTHGIDTVLFRYFTAPASQRAASAIEASVQRASAALPGRNTHTRLRNAHAYRCKDISASPVRHRPDLTGSARRRILVVETHAALRGAMAQRSCSPRQPRCTVTYQLYHCATHMRNDAHVYTCISASPNEHRIGCDRMSPAPRFSH